MSKSYVPTQKELFALGFAHWTIEDGKRCDFYQPGDTLVILSTGGYGRMRYFTKSNKLYFGKEEKPFSTSEEFKSLVRFC